MNSTPTPDVITINGQDYVRIKSLSKVTEALDELYKFATMENFSLGMPSERIKVVGKVPLGDVAAEYQPTEYVREATKLWRESWVLPIITYLIKWSQGLTNKENPKGDGRP